MGTGWNSPHTNFKKDKMKKKIKRWGTIVVLAHVLITWLHGEAHKKLGVDTFDLPGNLFIYIVIVSAPIIAMILLWTKFHSGGVWLLLGAMLGSLIFGAYNHFVAITADHVLHLPAGDSPMLFRITAVLLVMIEALGSWMAWQAIRKIRRSKADYFLT